MAESKNIPTLPSWQDVVSPLVMKRASESTPGQLANFLDKILYDAHGIANCRMTEGEKFPQERLHLSSKVHVENTFDTLTVLRRIRDYLQLAALAEATK